MATKQDPIGNSDKVLAYTDKGKVHPYVFRDLKNAFMAKKLPGVIRYVFLIRKKQPYFVHYNPTKGFSFEKLTTKQIEQGS